MTTIPDLKETLAGIRDALSEVEAVVSKAENEPVILETIGSFLEALECVVREAKEKCR